MKKALSVLTICIAILAQSGTVHAQDDKIKFGAYGRALQQTSQLDEKDTLHADNTSGGHILVDLGIKVNPDRKTEIGTILRLGSNLGGFFGAGNYTSLRQIYVKGIVADFLSYQVGDIYLKMTPYTMYNNYAELNVNEASVFRNLRNDYVYYDNFNRGNSWWQQGAHTNFAIGVNSKVLQTIKVDGFFLRNRTANLATLVPTAFHAGGRLMLVQGRRFSLGGNYLNLYDASATTGTTVSVRNPVTTFETELLFLDKDKLAMSFTGEGGFSQLTFKGLGDSLNSSGYFYDAGINVKLKPARVNLKLSYSYTSAEFYSSAAQTKRVNYAATPVTFPIYGNDPLAPSYRSITAFDIVRDPGIYNVRITPLLMSYNPAYGNAQPYGKATPNRNGVTLEGNYKDSLEKVNVDLMGAYLMESVTTDASTGRSFMIGQLSTDININKFIGFQKKILLHGGVRFESTNRSGDTTEVVNLVSTMVDGGLEIETIKRLDLLVGVKLINAQGSENIAVRNMGNQIVNYDFATYRNIDFQQLMLGYGLKYRFSPGSYLTAQYHTFTLTDNKTTASSYYINQFHIMFNLNF